MKLIIDGKRVEAEGKKSILDVARENDIYIPALCDHPILDPFGGCRLCIVEVQGRRGLAPSCSTYVEDGMEVKSDSPQLRKTRKDILGLILSEHPDACLVCSEKKNCDDFKSTIRKVGEVTGCVLCPNNGHCDLQDVVESVQLDKVDFPSVYRNLEIKKSDPFFDRNYNLCILCGRCVRVCHEIRGASTVHFINRGSKAVIGTALDRPLLESGCQFCGACVDVCPTGALTERAVKYEPLPDASCRTICAFCSVGCELEVTLTDDRILGAKPSDKSAVNAGQACVKGRFLIKDAVYSSRRIRQPMIRRAKELEEVTWDVALDFVAQKIKTYKGNESGMIHSPQLCCEDQFVVEKFAREVLKTKNIATPVGFSPLDSLSLLRQKYGIRVSYNFKKEDIVKAKVIFLTGTELAISHPLLWLDVLNAIRLGAKLVIASPYEQVGNRHASLWLPIKPGTEDLLFKSLAKVILSEGGGSNLGLDGFPVFTKALDKLDLSKTLESIGIDEQSLSRAAELLAQNNSCFIAGMELSQFSRDSGNMAALWNLINLCDSQLIPLASENNSRCIFELKRNDSRKTRSFLPIMQDIQEGQLRALYVIGSVPLDKKKKPEFLVLQDSYMSEIVEMADAVLPAATFAESEGTWINVEGRVQGSPGVIRPLEMAKPDWWILSMLAKKLKKKNFEYKKSWDILKEIKKAVPSFSKISPASLKKRKTPFVSAGADGKKKFLPLISRDPILKAGKRFPLVLWPDHSLDYYRNLVFSMEIKGFEAVRNSRWIRLNPEDAKSLKIKDGEAIILESPGRRVEGIAKITGAIPKGMVRASFFLSDGLAYPVSPQPVKVKRGK